MTELTESLRPGAFILSMDDEGNLSRDPIVVASGAGKLSPGSVLGKITASGKYVLRDHSANDGSQNAAAVLYAAVDATSADAKGVAVIRHAEVNTLLLQWKGSEGSGDKTAALAQLAALGVVAR